MNVSVEPLQLTPDADRLQQPSKELCGDVAETTALRSGVDRRAPSRFESLLKLLRRARPGAVLRRLIALVDMRKELRVYRLDRDASNACRRDPRIRPNAVGDLVLFQPTEPWQSRDYFLQRAHER